MSKPQAQQSGAHLSLGPGAWGLDEGSAPEWCSESERGQDAPTISLPPIPASRCLPGLTRNSGIPTPGFSSPGEIACLALGSPRMCFARSSQPVQALLVLQGLAQASLQGSCSCCSPCGVLSPFLPRSTFSRPSTLTQRLPRRYPSAFLTQPHCLHLYPSLHFHAFFLPHCG